MSSLFHYFTQITPWKERPHSLHGLQVTSFKILGRISGQNLQPSNNEAFTTKNFQSLHETTEAMGFMTLCYYVFSFAQPPYTLNMQNIGVGGGYNEVKTPPKKKKPKHL